MKTASKAVLQNPVIEVSSKGAARLRDGHVWVYRSDVKEPRRKPAPGSLVTVVDHKGHVLGPAFYGTSSQIAIRMLSNSRDELSADELIFEIGLRVAGAISYRDEVVSNTDACRLIFSEADFLPGLIVDRYNDVLTMQVLTQAMDRDDIRQAVLSSLREHFPQATIVERVLDHIRELEALPKKRSGVLSKPEKGPAKTSTTFTMNGLRFLYEAVDGQKTGAFLDQRENYVAAANYARGDALDIFTYEGGFALHLARKCRHVTGIDISLPALEIAEENAKLNTLELDWLEANAFDYLRDQAVGGPVYDTIVLDPPAFAKTRKNVETAVRGYKELNLRALKMLRSGGILVTCSCSFHLSETEFLDVLASAAVDAHRRVRILEKRNAAKDHPVLIGVPETNYLKCVICQVD